MNSRLRPIAAIVFAASTMIATTPAFSHADTAAGLQADSHAALASLYAQTPSAKTLGAEAKGILVFPNIVKAGFIVGAQYGDGILMKGGKMTGYYNSIVGSVGYQAGVEKFGYVLMFMSDSAMKHLNKSDGWELGAGPEVVIIDQGAAAQLSTTTGRKDVYAFYFDQKGLMAGVSIQGTKITRINK